MQLAVFITEDFEQSRTHGEPRLARTQFWVDAALAVLHQEVLHIAGFNR